MALAENPLAPPSGELNSSKKSPDDTLTSLGQGAGRITRVVGAALQAPAVAQQVIAGEVGKATERFASGFSSGLTGQPIEPPKPAGVPLPIASVQAAPKPAVAMHLIEPSNAASLSITPPNVGLLARNPASPTSVVAPAGGVAAPSAVIGQVNGRNITQADSDRLSAALPVAHGPVVFGPEGSFATSTAPIAAPTAAPAPAQITAPGVPVSSINTRAQRDAAKGHEAELARLNSVISRMEFGPGALNNPGERQLYAQLVAQRAGLIQQAGDLAGGDVSSQRQSATSRDVTAATQAGETARNVAAIDGALDRTLLAESGDTTRAMIQAPEYKVDDEGNVVRVAGTSFARVMGADGHPLRAPQGRAEGAITPALVLDSLTKQLAAEAASLQPNPERVASLQQQIAQLTGVGVRAPREAPAPSRTATNPSTGDRLRLNPRTHQWEPMDVTREGGSQ